MLRTKKMPTKCLKTQKKPILKDYTHCTCQFCKHKILPANTYVVYMCQECADDADNNLHIKSERLA